jgi:hypothetical protein
MQKKLIQYLDVSSYLATFAAHFVLRFLLKKAFIAHKIEFLAFLLNWAF